MFQPKHDHNLSSVARRMRHARVIQDTFVRLKGLTIVVQNGKKMAIYNLEDLEPFVAVKGKKMEEFSFKKDLSRNCSDTS